MLPLNSVGSSTSANFEPRNAKKYLDTTVPYSLNVNKLPSAKEHLKVDKTPAIIVLKSGQEVKRYTELNPEAMKGIDQVLA